MTTLEIIVAELERQAAASRGTGLGCFDATYPDRALIDGDVDLVALAKAVDIADETPSCSLYRTIYLSAHGYVVYRQCFDESKCTVKAGAEAHKQAVFVDEISANDYCGYRNRLVDLNGTDALPPCRR